MLSNSCAVRAKKLSNHFQPDAVKIFHKNIFLLEAFYIVRSRDASYVSSNLFLCMNIIKQLVKERERAKRDMCVRTKRGGKRVEPSCF